MKTLVLAAVLAAVGTPAIAGQGWGYGNNLSGGCGSSYQNYGRAGSSNGYAPVSSGYGYGYNASYGRGFPNTANSGCSGTCCGTSAYRNMNSMPYTVPNWNSGAYRSPLPNYRW